MPPPLDLTVIAALRAWSPEGGADPVAELLAAFLTDGRDRLQRMYDGVTTGDQEAIHRAAGPGEIDRARIEQVEREFERVSQALAAA